MDDTLQRSRDSFLHRYQGLRAQLPGPAATRDEAAADFGRLGLPGPRMEAWRYTQLRAVGDIAFAEPLVQATGRPALLDQVPAFAAPRLVFVDGRAREDLSDPLPQSLRPVTEPTQLARPDRDAFAALSIMLTEDGLRIEVPPGTDAGTLHVVSLATDMHARPVAFHPRHRIVLGAGARLLLVETALGQGVYLHNPLTEISVADGAALTHLRLQDESPTAFHIATLYAEVGAAARYDSFLLGMGARLARTEMHVRIAGDAGTVQLNCAQLLRGAQHGDFTTILAHDALGGRSRQTVRNVLDDTARGVFQGRIDVARAAQQTDGYQMNHALLLSTQAEADSKPELRINADDVKCSHGATVGALDPDQLFYLRSRGVPERDARAMLIRGFLSASLADIEQDRPRAMFEQAADRWWERQAA